MATVSDLLESFENSFCQYAVTVYMYTLTFLNQTSILFSLIHNQSQGFQSVIQSLSLVLHPDQLSNDDDGRLVVSTAVDVL